MRPHTFVAALLGTLQLAAQQGDNKAHTKMDPVVPEKDIPPSPVLSVDDALKSFKIAPGFVIEPVVTEPLVEKPVCIDFDPAGRMWVCEMRGYMPDIDGAGEKTPEGRISVLEDTDGDGTADKKTVFLDKVLLPRAVTVFEDGILFLDENRLCWAKRDGLKIVGEPEVIDQKFNGGGNVEHKPNGLMPDLDNWLYLAKSEKRLRRVNGKWQIEPTSFRGQWGIARDDWGRLYHNHNSAFMFGESLAPNLLQGNPAVKMKYNDTAALGNNRTWPVRVTPGLNRAYLSKANGYNEQTLDPKTHKLINCTAAAGLTVYRGTNFPKDWYGTGFSTESSVNLVKAIKIEENDGKLSGTHPLGEKEFLASTDERFRPVNVYTAPDGSLYLVDMYHGIIQHKTYQTTYLRQQHLSRGLDKPGFGHGRIYRIRSTSGKLEPKVDIGALKGLDLVKMLMHANAWHRETAQRVMVQSKDAALVPLLAKLAASGPPVARVHAFWTLEGMGELKSEHLKAALTDKDPKVQSSALWACTRLDPAELSKIEAGLVALKPAAPEVAPYLARVLGSLGTQKALDALAALLKDESKVRFIREAAVSGLHGHEAEFQKLADPKDKALAGWLEQGAKNGPAKSDGPSLKGAELASFNRGKALFAGEAVCFSCHGPDGSGVVGLGPPLDGSEWVTGKPEILINIMLHGMTGPVTVAGVEYKPTADMPSLGVNPMFTDQKLADIATYVRNEWDNKAPAVTEETVKKQRDATKDRAGKPWTAGELK
ncbi:HEAT repeat domain-containing protein [Luteolibacter arcticus]|uniref:HEAT repeat domain-containing protein n=1 Tax=Luteolibacter arcticus TaxID=1581411 RepID=A0ABT3GIA4_9BACT|nr:c-type cytochrome [Luteolibacter arcticus]MCW1923245.1 HEAT repeat domain-containing protein [Luteolibacter arcticus]